MRIERSNGWNAHSTLRDSGIVSLGADPQFRSLHSDSRWLPLLTKLGQSPEQLAHVDLDVELPRF